MTVQLEWYDVLLRLFLAGLAGAVLGLDRTERGRTAGLRTTVLVCLAAAVAMLQANLLLDTRGKPADSFISLDVMRLPLGILTGMGFIGAGAILRRGEQIVGLTTAAMLWLVTAIGLCLGGGQFFLGLTALCLAWIVLSGLKWAELQLKQERRALLIMVVTEQGPSETDVRAELHAAHFHVTSWNITYEKQGDQPSRTIRWEVVRRESSTEVLMPPFIGHFRQHPGVLKLRWEE